MSILDTTEIQWHAIFAIILILKIILEMLYKNISVSTKIFVKYKYNNPYFHEYILMA